VGKHILYQHYTVYMLIYQGSKPSVVDHDKSRVGNCCFKMYVIFHIILNVSYKWSAICYYAPYIII